MAIKYLQITNSKINKVSLYYTLFILLLVFFITRFTHLNNDIENLNHLFLILLLLISIIVHELIHATTFLFIIGWKNRSKIKIGFSRKHLCPYCHCSKLLRINQFRTATIMPFILQAFLPFLLSLLLLSYSVIFAIGSIGDLIIIGMLRKYENCFVLDDPKNIGCLVYTRNNN